ncbi:MAG: lytic transglycosylase domain-containing protein [Rhodospirillaceae bacterium]
MTRENRSYRGCLRLILMLTAFSTPWLLGGCAGTPSPQAVTSGTGAAASVESSIREASARFNMPVTWINAVIHQESGGRAHVSSPKGAMGLMQLMPATWNYLRAAHKLGNDPYNPHDNIIAGTAYLREMYDLYGSPGFLAAYNAGPGRYESCVRRHRPLPLETQRYVAAIAPKIDGSLPDGPLPTRPMAVAGVPPALLEVASLPVEPPVVPTPRPVPAARSTVQEVFVDVAPAPRPSRSPVAAARATPRPVENQTDHRVQADHRVPQHRPALPPGWYVPVTYANR